MYTLQLGDKTSVVIVKILFIRLQGDYPKKLAQMEFPSSPFNNISTKQRIHTSSTVTIQIDARSIGRWNMVKCQNLNLRGQFPRKLPINGTFHAKIVYVLITFERMKINEGVYGPCSYIGSRVEELKGDINFGQQRHLAAKIAKLGQVTFSRRIFSKCVLRKSYIWTPLDGL